MTDRIGDGPDLILFGKFPVPARSRTHSVYLARPNARGTYPTIVLVPPMAGITSSVGYLTRWLARWGFAVLALEPYGDDGPSHTDAAAVATAYAGLSDDRVLVALDDIYGYLGAPGTEWSDGDRIGLLGLGTGGRYAALSAVAHPEVIAAAIAYAPLGGDDSHPHAALAALESLDIPVLGIHGRADETVDVAVVSQAREYQPRSEWVIYEDVGHGFLDDLSDSYDSAAARDAMARLITFFERELALQKTYG